MRTEFYALAADGVLVVHAAFVVFVIAGQLLILLGWWRGWAWTRGLLFRLLHLLAIGFVVLEAWLGLVCPLTTFENRLRLGAGQIPYELSFIGYWFRELLFYSAPNWIFSIVYTVFGAIVLISFVLYPPRRNAGWKDRSKNAE